MYILILTIILNDGAGITSMQVRDLESCNKLGTLWVTKSKLHKKWLTDNNVFYICKRR